MKNIKINDVLFCIIAGVVLVLINQFGNSELLSKYSFLVALISYFIGKGIGALEFRKKQNEDKCQ